MATNKKGLIKSLRHQVSDAVNDNLLQGFTDDDLTSYVSLNKGFILNNLSKWTMSLEELLGEVDSYILAEILGCDEDILRGVDLKKLTSLIHQELVKEDVLLDTTTVDIGAHVPSGFGKGVARAHYSGDIKDAADGFVGELGLGFTLNELEDYVIKNEKAIKNVLDVYWWHVDDIKNIDNYVDLSAILGCDSRVVKDVDLKAISDFIYGILTDELEDAKAEADIVDLLWILRSAGVAYESRKSLGVDKDEYFEYIQGLIDDNGLSDLTGSAVVKDAVNIFIATPEEVARVEEFTGLSIPEYSDEALTVTNYEDGCSTIKTAGKSYDSIVRSVLALSLKDSTDPHTSWKVLTSNDSDKIKKEGWSEDAFSTYLHDVSAGTVLPMCLEPMLGLTSPEQLSVTNPALKKFLDFNLKSILSFTNATINTDDYLERFDLFLTAYTDYLENFTEVGLFFGHTLM